MVIDLASEFGARVDARLRAEQIIWLTTMGTDGVPQPSPVWFLYHNDTVVIFSSPKAPKVRNIRQDAHIALHFDSDGRGGNIVVITGTATVLDTMPGDDVLMPYFAKYAQGIEGLGLTPEQMVATYSAPISVTVEKVRGH